MWAGLGARGGEGTNRQNKLLCTFCCPFVASTQNRVAEGSRAKTWTKKRKEGSVRKVVAKVCCGNGEGPAPRNPGRKTLPKASNKTRQYKTRQGKIRQDKTGQEKTRQDNTR